MYSEPIRGAIDVSQTLRKLIDQYGPEAGPKLYRILKSRAAYKGVSTRRRHQIEHLTGRPYRVRRKAAGSGQLTLPLSGPAAAGVEAPG